MELYNVLLARKAADAQSSYVASLYKKGAGQIAEKIREEAEETITESLRLEKSPADEAIHRALVNESADLLFHLWVLLAHHEVKPDEVFGVLQSRFGTSGHDEKAARPK
jgi:phosphoribosyl-ATP pyrophosphohydrolase